MVRKLDIQYKQGDPWYVEKILIYRFRPVISQHILTINMHAMCLHPMAAAQKKKNYQGAKLFSYSKVWKQFEKSWTYEGIFQCLNFLCILLHNSYVLPSDAQIGLPNSNVFSIQTNSISNLYKYLKVKKQTY